MIAKELINEEIPPLKHTDTGEKALNWMDEFKVLHLPVLKNANFVGVVSESDILDQKNLEETLDKLFQHLPRPYVFEEDHLYQVLTKMSEAKLTFVPVLNKEEKYIGGIDVHYLMTVLAKTGNMMDVGGILVLEVQPHDYSLAQIAQIVESNNAKILSSYVMNVPDSNKIEVTLKINKVDLERIVRTFERYEYTIKATFQKSKFQDDLKFRYEALMNYLSL